MVLPYFQSVSRCVHQVAILGHEWATKTRFQTMESKIALKEIPTLKLVLTLVMTVTQVCLFINLHQETGVPP